MTLHTIIPEPHRIWRNGVKEKPASLAGERALNAEKKEHQMTTHNPHLAQEVQHLARVQRALKGMFTERMTITPEFAAMIVDRYSPPDSNRRFRPLYAASIARDIGKGRWNQNTHQGLAFYVGGTVADGQHRLWACARAGVSISLPVTYGMPYDVFSVIDQGAARTAADLIDIARQSIPNAMRAAAIARIIMTLRDARPFSDAVREINRADVVDFVLFNKELLAAPVRIGGNTARGIRANASPTVLGAAAFLIMEQCADEAAVSEFFERLADGVDLPKRSPILVLREAFKQSTITAGYSGSGERTKAGLAAVLAAWNRWRAGKTVHSLSHILYTREGGVPVASA